jgi:hypothetical protein
MIHESYPIRYIPKHSDDNDMTCMDVMMYVDLARFSSNPRKILCRSAHPSFFTINPYQNPVNSILSLRSMSDREEETFMDASSDDDTVVTEMIDPEQPMEEFLAAAERAVSGSLNLESLSSILDDVQRDNYAADPIPMPSPTRAPRLRSLFSLDLQLANPVNHVPRHQSPVPGIPSRESRTRDSSPRRSRSTAREIRKENQDSYRRRIARDREIAQARVAEDERRRLDHQARLAAARAASKARRHVLPPLPTKPAATHRGTSRSKTPADTPCNNRDRSSMPDMRNYLEWAAA